MGAYTVELIESLAFLVALVSPRFAIRKMIAQVAVNLSYPRSRVKIIRKIVNVILLFVALGILLFIWGVDRSELVYFISTLLTVMGISFFAQWSVLSNITSTLIIFSGHPASIGDTIALLDKDVPVEGKVTDIGVFFVTLQTADKGTVALPNNVFIQKVIRKA